MRVMMNEKTIRNMVEAGGVKQVRIIADGSLFHVDIVTTNKGPLTVLTNKGKIKTWRTLDSAAKWVRALGIGRASLDVAQWQPAQKSLRI
jgi:hypothetical protein